MQEGSEIAISKDDIEGVANKLEDFAATLPEKERELLAWVVARAQAADEADVQGYDFTTEAQLGAFRTKAAANLVRAAGFRGNPGGVAEQPEGVVMVRAIVSWNTFNQAKFQGRV